MIDFIDIHAILPFETAHNQFPKWPIINIGRILGTQLINQPGRSSVLISRPTHPLPIASTLQLPKLLALIIRMNQPRFNGTITRIYTVTSQPTRQFRFRRPSCRLFK